MLCLIYAFSSLAVTAAESNYSTTHHDQFKGPWHTEKFQTDTHPGRQTGAPSERTRPSSPRTREKKKQNRHDRLGHRPNATVLPLLLPSSAVSELFSLPSFIVPAAVLSTVPFSISASSGVWSEVAVSSGLGKTNLRASGMLSKGVDDSLARRRRERVRRRKKRWEVKMPASRRRLWWGLLV